jgi:hypothetical protein
MSLISDECLEEKLSTRPAPRITKEQIDEGLAMISDAISIADQN